MINLSSSYESRKKYGKAPDAATCPRCATWSPRNEIRSRFFWLPDLHKASVVEVRCGCYICPACPEGERWFMLLPPDFQTRRQYSLTAQRVVMDLVRKYRMSIEAATGVARDLLHLVELEPTTVLAWLRTPDELEGRRAHVEALVQSFSGQMALDEVYDGGRYVLKATDPLNGCELHWQIGPGAPCEQDARSFLQDLKTLGFEPQLVVTDGSRLYPNVIAEVWPDAKHQRG